MRPSAASPATTVGLMLPTLANPNDPALDPRRTLEAARRAEAGGFDGVYVGDHVLHPRPLLESVVTLSAIAASTERVHFGPCVLLLALRQPLVLARQLATLASFAPGRLRVGVGVGGEYPEEFKALGIPLAERGRRMEEGLRAVRALLSDMASRQGTTSTGGEALHRSEQGHATTTTSGDIPFFLGGWHERALRRAARYGDGWIGYLLGPESFTRRRAFLWHCRAALGASALPFTTGMVVPVHVAPSAEPRSSHGAGGSVAAIQVWAAAAWAELTATSHAFPERLFVAGPPGAVVEQLHAYCTAGCTELVLAPVDQGAGYLRQLDLLAEHVLPALKAFREPLGRVP